VPVIPVSIKGAFDAFPRGSKFPRPWKKVMVKFHKPLQPGELSYNTIAETVQDVVSNEVQQ